MAPAKKTSQTAKKSIFVWQNLAVCMTLILVPWALYVNFHPRFAATESTTGESPKTEVKSLKGGAGFFYPLLENIKDLKDEVSKAVHNALPDSTHSAAVSDAVPRSIVRILDPPILGTIPTNGAVPLYGTKHEGGDAIFALACNYPKEYYQRFVGSLRKFGYEGDIVLAVSPPEKMKAGVADYIKETRVVAYGFEVDCAGADNCKLQDSFLGYADPRPHRTFANIRYALYEYWLRQYSAQSYILILDFRDTFFQGKNFSVLIFFVDVFAANFFLSS